MKAIVFAGGVGTRLWPLSRKKSPKQFEKVIGDKSTLQLAVERLLPDFSWSDIYISTQDQYKDAVHLQLPNIPKENIIGEPEMRDVGPAVGLVVASLVRKYPDEPIAIVWSDHLVKKEQLFRQTLSCAEKILHSKKTKLVFITQKPRFPNQNLGWIEFGNRVSSKDTIALFEFKKLTYRPTQEVANEFFSSNTYAWNVGYFVTTPTYLWEQYRTFCPELFEGLQKLQEQMGKPHYAAILKQEYGKLKKISFDDAILTHLAPKEALVISEDLEWSDIGTWEALKEALQSGPGQNVSYGKVLLQDSKDTLLYNYTNQMIVALDLEELMIVNTHDVVLICHKKSVPKLKKLVESLSGSENEHLA